METCGSHSLVLFAVVSRCSEFKLYVSMLSHSTSEDEVRALFAPFGPLSEVVLLRQRDEQAQSKGSAFIKYPHRESAEAAIATLDRKYRDKVSGKQHN